MLKVFPQQRETKTQKLLDGLGTLWRRNSNEKIVVFATYLGTVELIAREIEQTYPGKASLCFAAAIMELSWPPSDAFDKQSVPAYWYARLRAAKVSISSSHACEISQ